MDRPPFYTGMIWRSYDIGNGFKDCLKGIGNAVQALLGTNETVASEFSCSAQGTPNLDLTLAAGQIYQWAPADAAPFGTLIIDNNPILQQGYAPQQTLSLNTNQLANGQSQWVLVQVTFVQLDQIRTGDPTGGRIAFYNSANPPVPLQGPNGLGGTLNTVRLGFAKVTVSYGAPATSGNEVPPAPDTGCIGLYLINLGFGQTAVTQGQIITAGPVTNAPNYPIAPFVAGLLNAHHNGNSGQAPKVDLTKEVQNELPLTNMPATNTIGVLSCFRYGHGSPVSTEAGKFGDTYIDLDSGTSYTCSVGGSSPSATTWISGGGGGTIVSTPAVAPWSLVTSFPLDLTASTSGKFALVVTSANQAVNLPHGSTACSFKFKNIGTAGFNAQITPQSGEVVDGVAGPISLSAQQGAIEFTSETTTPQWFID